MLGKSFELIIQYYKKHRDTDRLRNNRIAVYSLEQHLSRQISMMFRQEGCDVTQIDASDQIGETINQYKPDLVVLDVDEGDSTLTTLLSTSMSIESGQPLAVLWLLPRDANNTGNLNLAGWRQGYLHKPLLHYDLVNAARQLLKENGCNTIE